MVRDGELKRRAEEAGVEVTASVSHTLYGSAAGITAFYNSLSVPSSALSPRVASPPQDTSELVRRNGGKPPLTYQSFIKLADKLGNPPAPVADPPVRLPSPAAGAVGTEPEATYVPTWQEMGFKTAPSTLFKGGEKEALRRLQESMSDSKWVAAFEKPQVSG